MFRFARTFASEPLRIVGVLWPLALLTPFVPGLPRPSNGGPAWRQEATIALLLSATFALLWRRALKWRQRDEANGLISHRHDSQGGRALELSLAAPLAAFVIWAAASTHWALNVSAAIHYSLSWTLYLLLFLSLRRAFESARVLRASLTTLAAVVLVVSAANIIGYYGSPDSLLRQNGLGEPVAVCIPLFAALALRVRRARAALLCGAAATLGWLSMLEIAERAPLFGVLAGLALLASSSVARKPFRPRSAARALLLAAAFAACLALQVVPSPFTQSRHQNVFARVQQTSAEELNTRARFLHWDAAAEMWRSRPLTGVGAGGYDGAFAAARAAFAAAHPDSSLVEMNERYLSAGAHNEYLEILGELGATGLALFVAFCAALVWAAWRALRSATSPLVPGAVACLASFAVSSGASSVSFRWFGSGLIFFFAAALVTRFAHAAPRRESDAPRHAPLASKLNASRTSNAFARRAYALGLAVALVVLAAMCVQAANVLCLASAQASADPARAERLYLSALGFNPLDPATHYNYGVWLLAQKRERDALPHLRYAVARGFQTSTCYEYLAGAESNAGELDAAERTLSEGARVYPRSVFLRARHAAALRRMGRYEQADVEMAAALLLDSRAARGWQRLIEDDVDAAIAAAKLDPATVAMPGELQPEDAVFAVLEENERRFPGAVSTGWRARMHTIEIH